MCFPSSQLTQHLLSWFSWCRQVRFLMMPYEHVKSQLYLVITLQKQDLCVCVCSCLLPVCVWFSEGQILATMEESSRDFLYPGPRLSSREGSAAREILMKRSSSFPVGCFPHVPFISSLILILTPALVSIKLLRIPVKKALKCQLGIGKVICWVWAISLIYQWLSQTHSWVWLSSDHMIDHVYGQRRNNHWEMWINPTSAIFYILLKEYLQFTQWYVILQKQWKRLNCF